MSQADQVSTRFEDFLTPAFFRTIPPAQRADADVRQSKGSVRKYWAAVSLLVVYWTAWGGMLALWFLSAPTETLHGLLLAVLAAVGILVTVAVLAAASVMEELQHNRARTSVIAQAPAALRSTPPRRVIERSPPPPAPQLAAVPPPLPPHVIAEGELAGRSYRHFSDGSIEISTLLGLRRFSSLMDARQFIGPAEQVAVH